jgi:hypothetical protein
MRRGLVAKIPQPADLTVGGDLAGNLILPQALVIGLFFDSRLNLGASFANTRQDCASSNSSDLKTSRICPSTLRSMVTARVVELI